jgi:hypothetical protein
MLAGLLAKILMWNLPRKKQEYIHLTTKFHSQYFSTKLKLLTCEISVHKQSA